MNINISCDYTKSPRLSPVHSNLLCQTPFQVREFRVYKRRRFKHTRRNLTLHSHFTNFPLLDNFFQNLPSSSIDFLTPALGLTSSLALLFSSRRSFGSKNHVSDIGEWILFTSPTPFNRFVLLRCPSISFEGGELMQDVNERLVKEDRHFVRLNSGRMMRVRHGRGEARAADLEYQRVCVNTEDGGVIALDWPANLHLKEEHGLDTTVLLVPGTAEGSMDENVKSFVLEALRRGVFPLVMNPRGCAGSPLTTPRLFTAADSDDISTAIQFINKARPWTTLMGVGWGYGANMLTKYLAEVGERTPLTAATCIDNPFDLEEATRSIPYNISLNQKLADGLINILRSNKELFQGRSKGFDVEKALSAKNIRDFDNAISMVACGYEAIEDFYSKSSTRGLVGNIKVPVLFIQNDDETVPLFSIPRGLIAENPFTSLLLCSSSPAKGSISWCQHITIEWLTAVELGLLKGRHPLLKDVDVTINPSKGLALLEGRSTDKGGKAKKLLDLMHSNAINGYSIDPSGKILDVGDTAACAHPQSRTDSQKNLKLEDKGWKGAYDSKLQHNNSAEPELDKEEAGPADSERGQMLQTAEVVMNMLDITMPGTLKEEEKTKVLAAVNQGETVMKALQDAVPEDVREKLTAAVSGIMHAQGTNLKQGIGRIPTVSSSLTSKIQEKTSDAHSVDETKRANGLVDGPENIQVGVDKSTGGLGPEPHLAESMQRSGDIGQFQPMTHEGDISSSVRKEAYELGNNHENVEFIKEKASSSADSTEIGSETNAKPSVTGQPEKPASADEAINGEQKADQDGGTVRLETKDENSSQKKEEKTLGNTTDQNKMTSTSMAEATVSPAGSSSEVQPVEGEGNDNQKKENKNIQSGLDPNKSTASDSTTPAFTVSQALDALTGMDDSTQVAVNSVFGVIENMITQLEEGTDDEDEAMDGNEVKDEDIGSETEKQDTSEKKEDGKNDHKLDEKEGKKDYQNIESDGSNNPHIHENGTDWQNDSQSELVEGEPSKGPIVANDIGSDDSNGNVVNNLSMERKKGQIFDSNNLVDYSDRRANSIPLYINANPYGDFLPSEYFRGYLLSKPDTEPLDLDTTTDLFLDYFPEEGQWKLLEQPGVENSSGDITTHMGLNKEESQATSAANVNELENFIEPSYVILDTERQQEPVGEYETLDNLNVDAENGDIRTEELMLFVKGIILDSLRVEVDRRLSVTDIKEMESHITRDLEKVATAVSLAVGYDEEHSYFKGKESGIDYTTEKVSILQGENIIRAISSVVQDTSYLRRVLPVGVIVGSSLAALRKYFHVSTIHEDGQMEAIPTDKTKSARKNSHDKTRATKIDHMPVQKTGQNSGSNSSTSKQGAVAGLKKLNNDSVMVGAVTAALGASALLVHEEDPLQSKGTAESSSKSLKAKGNQHKEPDKLEDEKNQNIVTSLAEKALSVAGPVVPTKEDGEVDQERLVAMLADLGQKGGILRLVGKIALLWGGMRGAMSLTDRLIMFLHIAERPLHHRILGFVGMVLVLWSPVAVPLLPTLVQSWTKNSSSGIAQLACIIGFYSAVMILVVLWGRRIRGHENPFMQYGLDLTSYSKIQNLLKGLLGGIMLVMLIQSINALLGCVSLCWPSSLPPSSLDAMSWLTLFGKLLLLSVRGIITAAGVVVVEELLFRSWLPEEIATDLGYHRGIIISGLAFSLFQRSAWSIPGLWLLSLALAGIRQRSEGSLTIPIGLRAGIMASSFVLQSGGFLIYNSNFPLWVTGTHPFETFSGVVGLASALTLAVILYPRQPLQEKKLKRTMQE